MNAAQEPRAYERKLSQLKNTRLSESCRPARALYNALCEQPLVKVVDKFG